MKHFLIKMTIIKVISYKATNESQSMSNQESKLFQTFLMEPLIYKRIGNTGFS